MDGLFYDLRFTVRGLRRDWTFTLTAVATLTLAIALNVTVFAVMDAMLFRGFPHVKANSGLVYLQERYPSGVCCISYPDFADWRGQARAFEGMAFIGGGGVSFRDSDGRAIDTETFLVSTNLFGLLGVPPLLGRDFAAADEASGGGRVAILNYRFWNLLGRRPEIVGTTVQIGSAPATVIGVMPERFDFPTQRDLWMPVVHAPELQQRGLTPGGFLAVARLREGATIRGARVELETINRRLEAAYPSTNRGLMPTMVSASELNSGPDATLIWGSLWAGACFVFLIACANLSNLTLVRTIGRWRESATRIALGAGPGRMMRQILLESLAVVGVAAAFGWWITRWCVHTWAAATASRYQIVDYTVDGRTLSYMLAMAILAAVLCSLAPIARVVQLGVSGALKGDARGITQGLRSKRLGAGLIAGQMALAIVLLSGAGVLVRSFVRIVSAETGVRDPGHVLVGSIRLPSTRYPLAASPLSYFDRLEARLRAIPGVRGVSVANNIPVYGNNAQAFEIEGRPSPPDRREAVQFFATGPGYFQVVGADTISGRDFNAGDEATRSRVAIVNQSFVEKFWPGEEPLGQRVRATTRGQPGEWCTVVGVVSNIMQGDAVRQNFKPLVYVPFRQQPGRAAFFLARTRVPPDQVAQVVRAEVERLDPDAILTDFRTLKAASAFDRDFMDPEHSELGKHAAVAPAFAGIALLLSAIGLGAVIAHSVSQRTKEIGVRMAIGAAPQDIRTMILREGLLPVATGLSVGLAASLVVNRILQSQLVAVSPYDPATLIVAPALLILVAIVACQVPARRAVRVNPVVALRHE